MFAVVEIAGHQYKVSPSDKIYVPLLTNEKGTTLTFNQVLLKNDGTTIKIGTPVISNASVEATILDHVKDEKLIVFKKKRRKGYRVKRGHRQQLTYLQINSIS
ncbi:MAG: 50S ribosomal protein L21 [Ignavibacteria bacterium]|nr:50S ribosomal protein L21 [Ignavibacteria bacterium]